MLKSLFLAKNQILLQEKCQKWPENTIFSFKTIFGDINFDFWPRQSIGRRILSDLEPKNVKIGALKRSSYQIPLEGANYISPFDSSVDFEGI